MTDVSNPQFPDKTLSPAEHARRAAALSGMAYQTNDKPTRDYILGLARAHTRLSEGDAA